MVTGRREPVRMTAGKLQKPLKVWLINLEDPQDELDRRRVAASLLNIMASTAARLEPRLFGQFRPRPPDRVSRRLMGTARANSMKSR